MGATEIGIDLGTANILVYVKGKGIILKEPSVVAYDKDTNKIRAVGEEARQMIGRTPGNIMAIRPMRQGVISDYEVTEKMLKYFISKAMGKRAFRKPRVSICVPSSVTEVEKKAVEEATYRAGARDVAIIEEPIAAAIGAGIDITIPFGNMIVDIGGGTTDVAVIDEAIMRYVRKNYNLIIGERTAEAAKIKIGTVYPETLPHTIEVKGRDTVSGLPKSAEISSEEIREALAECIAQIMEVIHSVLEKTPPELAADVAERGIVLTGGGALLGGFEKLIEEETGINTVVAEDPGMVVAVGTGQYLDVMSKVEGK